MFDIKKRIETLEAEYSNLCNSFTKSLEYIEKDYRGLAYLSAQMTEKANLIADWKRELFIWNTCKNKED